MEAAPAADAQRRSAPDIVVVGSLNMDQVLRVRRLPGVGETVLGDEYAVFPGGKGANQAVAAARLGARVAMIGRVGRDPFGARLRDGLAAEGIDVARVDEDPAAPTGVALITVDASGHNTIVVASGANMRVSPADVDAAHGVIAGCRVLLLQLEIPVDAVVHAAALARRFGARVVLDPAPAPSEPLPPDLYRTLSVINPNEIEARALTGVPASDGPGARSAASRLLEMGCEAVVIKRGEHGAVVATGAVQDLLPGIPVNAVDSTAAGDAFAAALAVALAQGRALVDAARFANASAALSVTRMGAQPSMPSRQEVASFALARGLAIA